LPNSDNPARCRAPLPAKGEHSHVRVAFARIEARRSFMRDKLGVDVKRSILPLSATPLCLPPFWLRPELLLVSE
jgi:hypothetical protein